MTTSFVALPDRPAATESAGSEPLISNDGFFPDVDPAFVREAARIPPSVTPARLRAAILGAILTAAIDLRAFADQAVASGHTSLAEVPAPSLDGQSVQLLRYQRAIALLAKAELIERHRDFDLTSAGSNQVAELTPAIGELRRDAQHAIRDMLGRTRTTIDLI